MHSWKKAERLSAVVLLILGGIWIALSDLSPESHAQDRWNVPESAKKMKNPIEATSASIQKGKNLYAEYCAMCHGDQGKGDGPMAESLDPKPANLTDRDRIGSQSDGELFWKIAKGNPPMPDFEKALSEQEIWHLVNYLRTLAPRPASSSNPK